MHKLHSGSFGDFRLNFRFLVKLQFCECETTNKTFFYYYCYQNALNFLATIICTWKEENEEKCQHKLTKMWILSRGTLMPIEITDLNETKKKTENNANSIGSLEWVQSDNISLSSVFFCTLICFSVRLLLISWLNLCRWDFQQQIPYEYP